MGVTRRGHLVNLVAAATVLIAAALLIPRLLAPGGVAVLEEARPGGGPLPLGRYSLGRDGTFPVSRQWGSVVVTVRGGRARILSATRPCDPAVHGVYNPWISRKGETDVCLPHRVTLRVM